MRTTKFRAWNPKAKVWIFGELNGPYFDCALADGTQTGEELKDLTLEPWQQFTGLHSKNDVEIYEGDIVSTYPIASVEKQYLISESFGSYNLQPTDGIGRTLIFSELPSLQNKYRPTFIKVPKGGGQRELRPKASSRKLTMLELEVIGNIYSNPELLQRIYENPELKDQN